MKKALTFLVLFILMALPVSAQELREQDAQELVLGVSPASVSACIRAGDTTTLKFLVSTNVDIPQNVTVGFKGPESKWAKAEEQPYFVNTYDLFVTVSVPEGTMEDIYDIQMLVCREPDETLGEDLTTRTCLSPVIRVNVTDQCVKEGEEPVFNVKYAIILAITVLAAIFVLRQVSKTKKGKKK